MLGARLSSAARRRAFAICSAWCLITAGGVKRELDPESVRFILHRNIISGAERGGHLGTVLREDVGTKGRLQKNHEVGNLHTRFRSPCSPVADLLA